MSHICKDILERDTSIDIIVDAMLVLVLVSVHD